MDTKDTREAVDATNATDDEEYHDEEVEEVEEINMQQYYFISFTYKGGDWNGLVRSLTPNTTSITSRMSFTGLILTSERELRNCRCGCGSSTPVSVGGA